MKLEGCISCAQGFCWECIALNATTIDDSSNGSECCCNGLLDPFSFPFAAGYGQRDSESDSTNRERLSGDRRGRPQLADKDVKDPRSTMRKRARKALKDAGRLHPNMRCEWRGLANVGLEKHPIVGCRDGKATEVHHINKNTFDNELDNLVNICDTCHRRTHSIINPCTPVNNPNARIDYPIAIPRKATEDELTEWNNSNGEYPRADHSQCVQSDQGDASEDEFPDD